MTEKELIAEYRKRNGLETGLNGVSVNGVSEEYLEALLTQRLRSWYSELLATGDPAHLPVLDLKEKVQEARFANGVLTLRLPREGYRLLSVKVPEWPMAVTRFAASGSYMEQLQSDQWLRATPQTPLVVHDGPWLRLYGVPAATLSTSGGTATGQQQAPGLNAALRLEHLMMTAWPEDGSYEFDPADFPTFKL